MTPDDLKMLEAAYERCKADCEQIMGEIDRLIEEGSRDQRRVLELMTRYGDAGRRLVASHEAIMRAKWDQAQ
jgi:hypothetical protein